MRIFPAKLAAQLPGRILRLARTEAVPLIAVAVLAASAAIFLNLVDEVVFEGESRAFDQAVLDSLRVAGRPDVPIGPPWAREMARDITALGSFSVLTLMALIVTGFVLLQRQRAAAALFVGALLGGTALSEGLKSVFERERPAAAWRLVEVTHSSFPSGHSMLSAVAYLTLGVLLARVLPKKRLKAYAIGVAVVGVLTASAVTLFQFPGRRAFEWALLLPLAMPAYVVAYAYTDFLQFSGPLQTWLREAFALRGRVLPEVRSTPEIGRAHV